MPSPRRRRGEGKREARDRWKKAGLCESCGARKQSGERECSRCKAKRSRKRGRWRD